MKFVNALITLLLASTISYAQTIVPMVLPIVAVYDGDTINTTIESLPYPLSKMRIRIRDIDTPEAGSLAKCDKEALLAAEAKKFVQLMSEITPRVMTVTKCAHDKYGGRWVCHVNIGGTDVGKAVIDAKLAYYYTGGARRSWCN